MAWNPDPEVAALRDYAAKFDRPVVVAFSIHPSGDQFQMVTYGKTKLLCKLAASFGDEISKRIADGTIAAPQVEPGEVPVVQTWTKATAPQAEGEGG